MLNAEARTARPSGRAVTNLRGRARHPMDPPVERDDRLTSGQRDRTRAYPHRLGGSKSQATASDATRLGRSRALLACAPPLAAEMMRGAQPQNVRTEPR